MKYVHAHVHIQAHIRAALKPPLSINNVKHVHVQLACEDDILISQSSFAVLHLSFAAFGSHSALLQGRKNGHQYQDLVHIQLHLWGCKIQSCEHGGRTNVKSKGSAE